MSEMFNRGWMVIDVDLEDANGTMFRTRILFNEGSARAWQNHLHSDGFFGKVYDRADDMRVLASIEGASGEDWVTHWVPEPGVAASFAEHAHLADSLRSTASHLSRARATASSPPSSLSHCTACATTQRTAWPEAPPLRYRL